MVPWAHDYTRPPVGKVTQIKVVGGQLIADIEFDADNAFASDIARQYRDGYLNAVSVGFRPLEAEARSRAEGRDVRGVRYKRAELLEISAVPVPMHPAALRKAYAISRKEDPFDGLARVVRGALPIRGVPHPTWHRF